MKAITSFSEWNPSEESTWIKGPWGFGITFGTTDFSEISKQQQKGKFHFLAKIPESNILTSNFYLGEPDIVLNSSQGPFLPNIFRAELVPKFNIFGSIASRNIILTMKFDSSSNSDGLFYITGSASGQSTTSEVPFMLPVDNTNIVDNILVSDHNTQLKFQGQNNIVIGSGSGFKQTIESNDLLFDIGSPGLIPTYLISKTKDASNNRIFSRPNTGLPPVYEQFNTAINDIDVIVQLDSIILETQSLSSRCLVICHGFPDGNRISLLTVKHQFDNPNGSSFNREDIPSSITIISNPTNIFLITNNTQTNYSILIKNSTQAQYLTKVSGQWTSEVTNQHNTEFLKMDQSIILKKDSNNNLSIYKSNNVDSILINTITTHLNEINNFISNYPNPTYAIRKIICVDQNNITSLNTKPKVVILVESVSKAITNLLLFNVDFPDLPISPSVGKWNMETGFIDRYPSSFDGYLLLIVKSDTEEDVDGNITLKVKTINKSEINSFTSPNDFELKYNKNIHNITFNHLFSGAGRVAAHRFGLSPFKFPTIQELKDDYNLKFPDDFNYYSFLGNTYDVGITSEIKDLNGDVGSKLPKNLKFYKNFINNSNIVDVIKYRTSNNVDPIIINSTNNSVIFNPNYPIDTQVIEKNTIILMSIGNSKKIDNPFIWFESNSWGLIGIRQEGNIFTNGARMLELDHYNNQSLWMGIFPDVIKVEDTQEKSFNDLAPSIWNFDKLNSVEMGDYLEDEEETEECGLLWEHTVLEHDPDPSVVTDATLRAAIVATGLPWRVQDTATGIEMVLIPPGTFNMGCSSSQSFGCFSQENPVHQVTLTNAFYMGRGEVTQAQWQASMGSNPSQFQSASAQVPLAQVPQRPVERVSWNMIQGFLSQTGMRLPTEAEWEYAFRAGTTTAFHGYAGQLSGTNDDDLLGNIAWFIDNSNSQTRPVGGKLGNGFGLHDMAGNVEEWVNDRFGGYSAAAQTNPQGPSSGSFRVTRGGMWVFSSLQCRASQRNGNFNPDFSNHTVGFRVVKDVVRTPAWATLLEARPDPSVVTDATLRAAIVATGLAWRVKDTATGIEMVLIPPGTFNMGCSSSQSFGCISSENPVHQVTLTNAFYLGRYEVTQAQWQARMGSNPSNFQSASPQVPLAQVSQRPVENVSWNTIQPFLSQTGMRLPTEAEWEYAYRAGTTTAFHGYTGQLSGTNDDGLLGNIAWYCQGSCSDFPNETRPVGGKLGNGFGLHDMSGNVWEWVNDWYSDYSVGAQTNPQGPSSGTFRVMRGGSWFFFSNFCRASLRVNGFPDASLGYVGFRVARNACN